MDAALNPRPKGVYLLIADSFYPSKLPPEARTNTYLADQLSSRGWQVVVWAQSTATCPPSAKHLSVIHRGRQWGVVELLRLTMWIIMHRPTKVALLYDVTEFSLKATVTWIPFLAKLTRTPCTTLMTNGVPPKRSKVQDAILSLLGLKVVKSPIGPLALSERLILYSEADRRALFEDVIFEGSLSIVSPPSVGILRPRLARIEKESRNFVIGFFGLMYPSKGVEWIIRALARLEEMDIPVRLAVVGQDGGITSNEGWNSKCKAYEQSLRELAIVLNVDGSIDWHGFQEDDRANELICRCDLICLPFDEGLTGTRSSFVECARVGMPVITTLTDATDDYLRAPDSGIIFVPPQNPEAIADAIAKIFANPNSCLDLGQKIKKFADSTFRDQFIDAFESS
jgi:glycosyltransferase involved in cell wall biosynthesis